MLQFTIAVANSELERDLAEATQPERGRAGTHTLARFPVPHFSRHLPSAAPQRPRTGVSAPKGCSPLHVTNDFSAETDELAWSWARQASAVPRVWKKETGQWGREGSPVWAVGSGREVIGPLAPEHPV